MLPLGREAGIGNTTVDHTMDDFDYKNPQTKEEYDQLFIEEDSSQENKWVDPNNNHHATSSSNEECNEKNQILYYLHLKVLIL